MACITISLQIFSQLTAKVCRKIFIIMKKNIRLLILSLLIVIVTLNSGAQNMRSVFVSSNTFDQDTVRVYWYFATKFVFGSGFWVYKDTVSDETDSISLVNISHGFYGPNPAFSEFSEYYLMDYYSHTYDSSYNDFFWRNLWRRNGGGEYAELGQPVMDIGQFESYPEVGNGFNGYEIIDILDSLIVGSQTFYHVVWSHIYKDQQYQHEFDFDTDLFFGENVGIVRKEYTDNAGVHHVWNLTNWEIGPLTGIGVDDLPGLQEKPIVCPNPTDGLIRVYSEDLLQLELFNMDGVSLIKTNEPLIGMTRYPDGLYFLRISDTEGRMLKIEKVLKVTIP